MGIVVANAGSSTLKLSVIGGDDETESELSVDRWDGNVEAADLAGFLDRAGDVEAVGHRVVHGGRSPGPLIVTSDVEDLIGAMSSLAPLHQPRALAAIKALREALPTVPNVACFDTAFHVTVPAPARTYALPQAWRQRWDLDRYGFHGLSHAWVARRAPKVTDRDGSTLRVVSCHLGAGASVCAIRGGRSVDTSMGFTPLEGLVMETRSGSVDPGLVLWLIVHGGLTPAEVADGLERHAGLAGLSGVGGDMRRVLEACADEDAAASLAFDVYIHRLRREITAMTASLGGIDVLVFTGGVGEHSPAVRASVVDGLTFLGLGLDPELNEAATADADITGWKATGATAVVTSREDIEIARQVRRVVAESAS
jgi:acetate kinase